MRYYFVIAIFYIITCANCATIGNDLTLVPEARGTLVVIASLSKIRDSQIFPKDDQQMLRRIAFVETMDGTDPNTYSGSNNNGGIWQISKEKYEKTKNFDSNTLQMITTVFNIVWVDTTWEDLRMPFYSALASRIYLEWVIQTQEDIEHFPFSTDIAAQSNFWITFFTSSDKTEADFAAGAIKLNEKEQCVINDLDVYYLLDDSSSLGVINFNITKEFLINLTDNFPISSEGVHIGLITFEYKIRFRFFLNTFFTKDEILDAIDEVPYTGIGTNTSGALDEVRINGFTEENGARDRAFGVPRIVIVVTDGRSFEPEKTRAAAAALHNESVIVYAIGISRADRAELEAIASDDRFAISVRDFDESILSAVQVSISRLACVASQALGVADVIETLIQANETKFIDYPILGSGTTIIINATNGSCQVFIFGSKFITTPNAAFNDFAISTEIFEDVFIGREDDSMSMPNDQNRVFLAVAGGQDYPCEIQIRAVEGDVSTDPATITSDFPSVMAVVDGEQMDVTCTATGKPLPTLQWYRNGTLMDAETCDKCDISIMTMSNTSVSSRLVIDAVNASDVAVYTCIARNVIPSGPVENSESFTLEIAEPDDFSRLNDILFAVGVTIVVLWTIGFTAFSIFTVVAIKG